MGPAGKRLGGTLRWLSLTACLLCAIAGCKIPSDPHDTLDRVRGGVMRVGLIHNPPWTHAGGDKGDGIEMDLVRELAGQLDAEIEWHHGPEHELIIALEHVELDLVIGGLTRSNPWSQHVALSRPYFKSTVVIAAPAGARQLDSISGVRIAVPPGSAMAAYVRAEGGIAVPLDEAESSALPQAMPDWRANALGLQSVFKLKKQQHVIALPPGENRWVVTVERFLYASLDKRQNELVALASRWARVNKDAGAGQ